MGVRVLCGDKVSSPQGNYLVLVVGRGRGCPVMGVEVGAMVVGPCRRGVAKSRPRLLKLAQSYHHPNAAQSTPRVH